MVDFPSQTDRDGDGSRGDARSPVETRIWTVGEELSRTLRAVLDELPGRPDRPNQLADLLGVNRNVSGRVLNAVATGDPLTVAHVAPGPEPLRKLLRAAKRHDVPASILSEAEQSVRAFERLIRESAGDRPGLDAIISSLLPSARGKFEQSAKHTIFRGTSLLKGAAADLWLHAALVHPSRERREFHDVAHLHGTLGLRRLRPGITVKFTYRQFGTTSRPCRALDGTPAEEADGTELDRFCTLPPAPMTTLATDDGTVYALAGDEVGPASATDKLLAEVRPSAMGRHAAAAPRNRKSLFVAPEVPVRTLVFDVLLHEDVYPASHPGLAIYDTAVAGMASVNDPARDADRLDVRESITVLGHGRRHFALAEMPAYVDMLAHATGVLGWDLEAFRGYRCVVQYPMHGAQVCMVFDAPPAP